MSITKILIKSFAIILAIVAVAMLFYENYKLYRKYDRLQKDYIALAESGNEIFFDASLLKSAKELSVRQMAISRDGVSQGVIDIVFIPIIDMRGNYRVIVEDIEGKIVNKITLKIGYENSKIRIQIWVNIDYNKVKRIEIGTGEIGQ